jgi:hypothetical protein
VSLTPSQKAFATSREPFPAFVGGYGSGKSAAAIARAMALKAHFRECDVAYYLPTYPLVEDIAYRRFPELCERKGWAYKLNRSSAYIEFPGAGRIVFRTMERPERIVGYEVAHSILDELDTLPTDKARDVWNRVIARNRQKCAWPNTVAVATTPEGFRFVYDRWVKNTAPGYVIYRAKTEDNAANLPPGYIDNLRNSYPTNLLSAYLEGQFVNLASGTVYHAYDRALNGCNDSVIPGEHLYIGMDFNVGKMAAIVHVKRDGLPRAVDEIIGGYDTPDTIRRIKERFWRYQNGDYVKTCEIRVYPDASGGSRKSVNASESDIKLLRQAGFTVSAPGANPPVKDRINAMNAMFLNDKGERRYLVNAAMCPTYADDLEQQAWSSNGEPDKSSGNDHSPDAGGYFIHRDYPLTRPAMNIKMGMAY